MRLGQATPQGVAIALPLLTQDPRASGLGAFGSPVARVVVDDDNFVDGFEAAEIAHGGGDPGLLIQGGEYDAYSVALPHPPIMPTQSSFLWICPRISPPVKFDVCILA